MFRGNTATHGALCLPLLSEKASRYQTSCKLFADELFKNDIVNRTRQDTAIDDCQTNMDQLQKMSMISNLEREYRGDEFLGTGTDRRELARQQRFSRHSDIVSCV